MMNLCYYGYAFTGCSVSSVQSDTLLTAVLVPVLVVGILVSILVVLGVFWYKRSTNR